MEINIYLKSCRLYGRMDGNMKKHLGVLAAILILTASAAVFIFEFQEKKTLNEATAAFKSLETEDIYKELYIFSSIPKESENKTEAVWSEILNWYDLRPNTTVTSFDKDGNKTEDRQTDDGKVFVQMTSTSHKDNNSLYVNINTSDNDIDLENSMTDMEKIFSSQNLKYEVTLSIKGTKLGKLNKDEIFNIKNKLIKKCNANMVSQYEENGIYSYTAFSKDMGRYVRVGGKKVNLNIAIRYSEADNKTYIYLATPIIRTEV
jgi:Protein of unknown function (DUF1779).